MSVHVNGKVRKDQRFSAGDRCPKCGGYPSLPRGRGERCVGFYSEDGQVAFCSRLEAGAEKVVESAAGPLFMHRVGQADQPTRPKPKPRGRPTRELHYDYTDRQGELLFQVVRKEFRDGSKTIVQRQPSPDRPGMFVWSLEGVPKPLPLYNIVTILETTAAGDTLIVVEGEPHADRLGELGLLATTSAMGAGKAGETDWSPVRGLDVVLSPDFDDVGRKHMEDVARRCREAGAARVRWLELPGLPERGDVLDWLDDGGTAEDLRARIESAPDKAPADEHEPSGTAWIESGEIATLADVEAELGAAQFLWDGWIQFGAIAAVIAEGGTGKTRTVAEWAARLWHGRPMPDGSPNPLPAGTKTLWLCYDRNWRGLIKTVKEFGVPTDAILLPTHRKKPLFIPDFDNPETVALLYGIVRKHRPGFVAIDTTTYATAFNTAKAHETKLAFDPLINVMVETMTACIAITHTNARGEILNRRLRERVRTEIKISRPDPGQKDRLCLEVRKSEDKRPPALGMTFRDGGIDYDDNPPTEPETTPRGPRPEKSTGFAEWLWNYLQAGPAPMVDIIGAARDAGLLSQPTAKDPKPSLSPLYNARNRIPRIHPGKIVDQFEATTDKGKALKHWQVIDAPEDSEAAAF